MKVQLPWYGKASGRSAGTIYQSYWGATYTRSMPFNFHYPDTPSQQVTQAKYYNIQRVWWEVYPFLAESIPANQRHNKNVFNVLSKGLYKSIMTYMEKDKKNIVPIWGLDTRKTVEIKIQAYSINHVNNFYYVHADILEIVSKRNFTPDKLHILFYNCTQQTFMYGWHQYTGPIIRDRIFVGEQWPDTDIIIAYIALSDPYFMSNFILCSE